MLRFNERFPRLSSIMNATSLSIDGRLRGKRQPSTWNVRKTITKFPSNSGGMMEYGRDDERGCKAEHGCDRLTDAARHDVTSSSSSSRHGTDRRPISHGPARPGPAQPSAGHRFSGAVSRAPGSSRGRHDQSIADHTNHDKRPPRTKDLVI